MKNTIAAVGAMLLISWAQAARAIPDTSMAPDDVARERTALQAAFTEWQKDDFDAAALANSLKAILADPAFVALSDDEHHAAYLLYGAALSDAKDWANAQSPIKVASEMPQSGEFDWGLRFQNDFRLHDYADAVPVATRIAKAWPEKLSDYYDASVFTLDREAKKLPPAVRGEFLEAFHAAHWKPKNQFDSADYMWLSLIRIRLAHGDVTGAKAIAMDLRAPGTMRDLHIDKTFDVILRDAPDRFDVMKAYESALAELRTESAAAPDKLEGINTIAEILIVMARPEEALAATSTALARLRADPKAFSDAEDKQNWTEDIQSRALFALGRSEEAFAALVAGAKKKENGQINVSQPINLADNYVLFDKPTGALNAVSSIELNTSAASPYGLMALEDARASAYFILGDTANLNKALDYMRVHKDDGTGPYLNTMLFIGHIDDVAAEVIAELRDPEQRTNMLGLLQNYAPDPHPTRRSAAMHEAWIGIRSRPDVAAEIAKFGYINKYPLRLSTY